MKADFIEIETISEQQYYKFYLTGIAAKQMTDNKYAVASVSDNKITYSAVDKYSVLTYAVSMLADGKTPEALKNLLTGMLDYGARAQIYFEYQDTRLANDDWAMITVVGGTLSDGMTYGLELVGSEIALTPDEAPDGKKFWGWETSGGRIFKNTVTVIGEETYTAVFEEPYSKGLTFSSNGDGTCSVTGLGTCTDTELKIPPISPDGDFVIAIGAGAFQNKSSLTSVSIPSGVTSIGKYAFGSCGSMTSITFQGTKEQRNAIAKGYNWDYDNGNCTGRCTDGDIAKS